MQVPEEFRCCICLSAPDRALQTSCPHLVCVGCTESGGLTACPVCRADFPEEREEDTAFAERLACATVTCECGATVPVTEVEAHSCETTRKRKRPDLTPPLTRRPPPTAVNRSTFACPFCDERNLTTQGLLEHCEREHPPGRGPSAAVCPICAAMPWGDPHHVTRDFLSHLRLRHRCDYSVLTDFDLDEDATVQQALNDSLRSAGYAAELEEDERILQEILRQSALEAGVPAEGEAEQDDSDHSATVSSGETESQDALEQMGDDMAASFGARRMRAASETSSGEGDPESGSGQSDATSDTEVVGSQDAIALTEDFATGTPHLVA